MKSTEPTPQRASWHLQCCESTSKAAPTRAQAHAVQASATLGTIAANTAGDFPCVPSLLWHLRAPFSLRTLGPKAARSMPTARPVTCVRRTQARLPAGRACASRILACLACCSCPRGRLHHGQIEIRPRACQQRRPTPRGTRSAARTGTARTATPASGEARGTRGTAESGEVSPMAHG